MIKISKKELTTWTRSFESINADEEIRRSVLAYVRYMKAEKNYRDVCCGSSCKVSVELTRQEAYASYWNALQKSAKAFLKVSAKMKKGGFETPIVRFYNNEDIDDCREVVSLFGKIYHVILFARENNMSIKDAVYSVAD